MAMLANPQPGGDNRQRDADIRHPEVSVRFLTSDDGDPWRLMRKTTVAMIAVGIDHEEIFRFWAAAISNGDDYDGLICTIASWINVD
jgi:hypothetical protein